MPGQENSPRGFETLKAGQTVNVLNMTMGGRYILEGRAEVAWRCEGHERRAMVRFLSDGEDAEEYERFIDPRAQGPAAQVQAWLALLNRRDPKAGDEDVDGFDKAFDLDATVPAGRTKGDG